MVSINTVGITGRLTKDPEVKYNNKNTCIASFSVAVRKPFKKDANESDDFFDVNAYGKTAEFIEKYVAKGTKVEITGRLSQNKWTDKEGANHSRIIILADRVEFAESRTTSQQSQAYAPEQVQNPEPAPQVNYQTQSQVNNAPGMPPKPNLDDFMNIPNGIDEQLPFT